MVRWKRQWGTGTVSARHAGHGRDRRLQDGDGWWVCAPMVDGKLRGARQRGVPEGDRIVQPAWCHGPTVCRVLTCQEIDFMKRWVRILVATLALCLMAGTASAQVALLDSASTREFFARHYTGCQAPTFYLPNGEEYQRYFRGWEFVLKEMGVPFTFIGDADLTSAGLARFSVLILSNIASLSVEQTRAVHQWTIRGGRLLATFGTGYKGTTIDRREADLLKKQKGHTFGLHQLWHDPVSKVFGSEAIGGVVDVQVSRFTGPTAGLRTLPGGVLPYGALANVLIQRPPQAKDVLAWLRPAGGVTDHAAVISTRSAKGHTVYFSFAPEYIVSKEFE